MKPKRITRAHMATIYALILKGKLTPDEAQQDAAKHLQKVLIPSGETT